MAHIVEFKIAGLAGRKEIYHQKLNRDVNVFFGLNGSGKTSLLKILDSAMSGDASTIEATPFEWAEVLIYSLDYRKNFLRTIRRPTNEEKGKRRRRIYRRDEHRFDEIRDSAINRREINKRQLIWKYKFRTPTTATNTWSHSYLPTWRLYGGRERLFPSRFSDENVVVYDYDWEVPCPT